MASVVALPPESLVIWYLVHRTRGHVLLAGHEIQDARILRGACPRIGRVDDAEASLRQRAHGARRALCICLRVRTHPRPMPPTRILSPFDVHSSSPPSFHSASLRLLRDSSPNLQRSRVRHPPFSPIHTCHNSRGSRSCVRVLLKTLPSIPVPRAIWHADRAQHGMRIQRIWQAECRPVTG